MIFKGVIYMTGIYIYEKMDMIVNMLVGDDVNMLVCLHFVITCLCVVHNRLTYLHFDLCPVQWIPYLFDSKHYCMWEKNPRTRKHAALFIPLVTSVDP